MHGDSGEAVEHKHFHDYEDLLEGVLRDEDESEGSDEDEDGGGDGASKEGGDKAGEGGEGAAASSKPTMTYEQKMKKKFNDTQWLDMGNGFNISQKKEILPGDPLAWYIDPKTGEKEVITQSEDQDHNYSSLKRVMKLLDVDQNPL